MVTAGPALSQTPATLERPSDPRRTLTSIGLLVYDWDLASDEISWGGNAAEVLGIPDMAAWGSDRVFASMVELTHSISRADAIAGASGSDEGSGVPYAAQYGLRLPSSRVCSVDDTGRWFADTAGRPARAHGTMRLRPCEPDETDMGRVRTAFLAQVGEDVTEATGAKRSLTVFAVAVENLSELNDELGFEATDEVIGTVLARLGATLRGRDRFVRYSGNRFAVALRGCGQAEAKIAADRMSRFVSNDAVGTARGSKFVKIVIGAATAPDHAIEATTLLRRAEASLGLAKRRVGTSFLMYDPRLFRAAARSDRLDPALDCVEMLNARRITLALQPVVEAGSRKVAFNEALLRIEGEDGRIRPAGDVIPALERAGLVHLADARMLELVVEHLACTPDVRVALNVSPVTMSRPDWLPMLAGHLGSHPGIAGRLIVEITETAAIHDPDATRRDLEGIKALGAAVAIDDFGAGHTSFRHLRHFPLDLVKVDGAFVQNLARSPNDRFFVRTLVDLARHLGIATVAEWVEDEESACLLASWGVDYLQGDHCGRPELIQKAKPNDQNAAARRPDSLVA